MHTSHLATALALCLIVLSSCSFPQGTSPSRQDQDQVVTQDGGANAPTDPLDGITADSRVVALSRSVAEMWLLAGGQLAGVPDDARGLDGLDETAEGIGSLTQPDLERILALQPDLVMLTEDLPSHQQMRASLDEAQVPVLVVDVDSFDDYAQTLATLTTITGRDDLFDQNVTAVRAAIDEVLEHAAQPDRGSYLALNVSPTTSRALGDDDFACAMLDDMGLSNAADDMTLDAPTPDAIATVDPDWVFVIYQGDLEQAQQAFQEAFSSDPAWSGLTSVQAGHVVVLPKDLFQYKPNARWASAYAYLSQVLNVSWA